MTKAEKFRDVFGFDIPLDSKCPARDTCNIDIFDDDSCCENCKYKDFWHQEYDEHLR